MKIFAYIMKIFAYTMTGLLVTIGIAVIIFAPTFEQALLGFPVILLGVFTPFLLGVSRAGD